MIRVGSFVAATVVLGVLATSGESAAGTVVVPSSASGAIRTLAGQDAYLPTFLPSGYHYKSWKKDTSGGTPHEGQTWFEVAFSNAAAVLTWNVMVIGPKELPCGQFSAGTFTYNGRSAYWSHVNPTGGRNFWTCVTSASGRTLFLTVAEQGAKLSPTDGAKMAASATLAPSVKGSTPIKHHAVTTVTRTKTLTQARGVQLAADGAAWESGMHAYFAAAPRCFVGSRSLFAACLRAAFTKWTAPFARARRDVQADAKTVKDACNSRLLDYLGSGGAGDALQTTMGFAQKDALARKLTLLNQTLEQLVIPAFKATDKTLRAAETVC